MFGEDVFRNSPNGRTLIDQIFLQDLNAICDNPGWPRRHTPADRTACKTAANTYYAGVTGNANWDKLFG